MQRRYDIEMTNIISYSIFDTENSNMLQTEVTAIKRENKTKKL